MYTSFDSYTFLKVLSLLKSHHPEFVSGEKISKLLKISRVSVWKSITKIQSLGYKIKRNQKLGYKLTDFTDYLLPWEVKNGLRTTLIGKKVYYFDKIDSTQNFALKLASDPLESGSVVIARKQSHGRGRRRRKWISPHGGIWLSVVFHPEFEISNATIFPMAASLALATAIEKVLKLKPKLKWPNDIILNRKKAAGMLVDVSVESGSIEHLVLGVGINFKINSSELEKSLKHTENFYGVTSLIKKNNEMKPVELVQSFLQELEKIYQSLIQGDVKNLTRKWSERSETLGKRVTISVNKKKTTGKAMKIDSDGALVISDKGKMKRILVGDVIT